MVHLHFLLHSQFCGFIVGPKFYASINRNFNRAQEALGLSWFHPRHGNLQTPLLAAMTPFYGNPQPSLACHNSNNSGNNMNKECSLQVPQVKRPCCMKEIMLDKPNSLTFNWRVDNLV